MTEGMTSQSEETKLAVVQNELSNINKRLDDIASMLNGFAANYVTKLEFEIWKKGEYAVIRALVFGMAGLILLTVIGAGLAFLIK
jgi:transcriptional regulator with AAA-type ATPase domain